MNPTVTIGEWTFDNSVYDAEADVLYLSIGEPRPSYGENTPEGHILMFDLDTDEFCGLTLVGISRLIDRDDLSITVPRRESINAADLKLALA